LQNKKMEDNFKGLLKTQLPEASPLRRLSQLAPFPIAGVILYFVLRNQDWGLLLEAIQRINLPLFVCGSLIYTLGFYFSDTLFNYYLWNRILIRIKYYEVLKIRGFSIFLMVLFPPLAVLATLIYMVQKKKIRTLPMLSTNAVLGFADMFLIIPQMAFALIVLPNLSRWFWLIFFLFCLGLILGIWLFPLQRGKKYLPRLYNSQIVYALRILPAKLLPPLVGIRALWPFFQVLGHWLALGAIGIHPPLPMVILVVIFITMTTFMPFAVAGFGAPNAVALLFLSYAPNIETVNAYSLLFQAGFLFGRIAIGLICFYPFWKEVLKSSGKIELAPYSESFIYKSHQSKMTDSGK